MVEVERGGSIAGRAARSRRASAIRRTRPTALREQKPIVAATPDALAAETATAAAPRRQRPSLPAVDPGASARSAAALLLGVLGDSVDVSVEQILAGDEPEAIHDLRIALRRTRCLIGPLRGVFTRRESERLRRGLRWLGEISGPARDYEPLLERLDKMRGEASSDELLAVDSVMAVVESDRDTARRALVAGLRAARFGRLREAWRRLAAPPPTPDPPPASDASPARRPRVLPRDRPIAAVAGEAIDRAWRRVVRRGEKLSDSSAPETFHQVRIDAKKLRYLIELFRSTHPEVDLDPTIEDLKSLQNCLGDLNDARVQKELLARTAPRMAEVSGAPVQALVLIGRLIERSDTARLAEQRRFHKRFAAIAAKDNRRRVRSLANG